MAELRRIAHEFEEHDVFNAREWDTWRTCLINSLTELWLLRAIIAALSEQSYDNRPILFREYECDLDCCIEGLGNFAEIYNAGRESLPSWSAIDLTALRSSIQAQVPAAVDEQIADARAKTLQAMGEWKAACDLRQPYALARIERLRSIRKPSEVPG